jgi:hypothetical protein
VIAPSVHSAPDDAHGPTNANNLVGLCWTHHRLVHEGHWTVTGNPEHHDLSFHSPQGRTLTSRPQPLGPTLLDHLEHLTGLRFHQRPPDPDDTDDADDPSPPEPDTERTDDG